MSAPRRNAISGKNKTAEKAVTTALSEDDGKSPDSGDLAFTPAERALAGALGIKLDLPISDRMDLAVERINRATRLVVEAGTLLLSVRAECRHGEFEVALEERGIPSQRASELMSYARFAARLSPEERERILALPKSKALVLAKADPEVLQALLEDDAEFSGLAALSVRDMQRALRAAEAKNTDLRTQNEAFKLERDVAREQLRNERDARIKTTDAVPLVVQDIRLECAALRKKALLSIDDIDQLVTRHVGQAGDGSLPDEWVEPLSRHLYAALISLHARTGGLIAQLREVYGDSLDGDATPLDAFGEQETLRCARMYRDLTMEHQHEATLREWEREISRPRGKGRPRKRPV